MLPPPTVELEIVEVTGTTAPLGGVSLGWTVERLRQAIGEQRGIAPELLRLIGNDQPLDGKESLLLSACGISAGEVTRMHVVPQTAEQAAERRAASAAADATLARSRRASRRRLVLRLLLCGRGGVAAAGAAPAGQRRKLLCE